jgi:hypothetical protein
LLLFLRNCDFNVQSLLNINFIIRLWLLDHDLKAALFLRCELHDIICIVVSYVKVSQVEVTRCKLFVIVNIIQKGWIVSQWALLAENVVSICQQIVISPVNLTSTSFIIITHHLAVDNISFLLFSAVWVHFVWGSTLLAERSGMQ